MRASVPPPVLSHHPRPRQASGRTAGPALRGGPCAWHFLGFPEHPLLLGVFCSCVRTPKTGAQRPSFCRGQNRPLMGHSMRPRAGRKSLEDTKLSHLSCIASELQVKAPPLPSVQISLGRSPLAPTGITGPGATGSGPSTTLMRCSCFQRSCGHIVTCNPPCRPPLHPPEPRAQGLGAGGVPGSRSRSQHGARACAGGSRGAAERTLDGWAVGVGFLGAVTSGPRRGSPCCPSVPPAGCLRSASPTMAPMSATWASTTVPRGRRWSWHRATSS